MALFDRLRKRSVVTESGCWEWQGSCNQHSYGNIWVDNKCVRVHRVSWKLYKGPIPDDTKVLHSCDNPSCWNPEHLFLGTQIDNVQDMITKGRKASCKGSMNGNAKVNEDEVKEILNHLELGTLSPREISEKYRIARTTVSYIKNHGWTDLKERSV